jgi:hypothetical protein
VLGGAMYNLSLALLTVLPTVDLLRGKARGG